MNGSDLSDSLSHYCIPIAIYIVVNPPKDVIGVFGRHSPEERAT